MSNVRIKITISYDEIPNEVEKLIHKSMSKMFSIAESLKNGTTDNHGKVLEDIETARKKLVLVDANLEDAYNILLGYLQNELKVKEQKAETNESQDI